MELKIVTPGEIIKRKNTEWGRGPRTKDWGTLTLERKMKQSQKRTLRRRNH